MSTVGTPYAAPTPVPIVPTVAADDVLYEVIDGQQVEISHMGAFANFVATMLASYIQFYLFEHPLGSVATESLFTLDATGPLRRRPDIAFVAYDRWPGATIPNDNAWDAVPDLAVEVVSPTNTADEIDQKVIDYFRCGVRLVWVVFPETARVHVYTSATEAKIIERDGELCGEQVLPGFKIKVADLYRGLIKPTDETVRPD